MSRPMTNIEISLMIDAEIDRQRARMAPDLPPAGDPDGGPCVACGVPLVRDPHPIPDGHMRLRAGQRCAPCVRLAKQGTR